MSIPLPNLDDRRWAELVEEARALIPVYAPEWTDHNIHDPGITLIELFAWLTEANIYSINRIPDRHKRKFLSLIGISPQPPCPSHTVLGFSLHDKDNKTQLFSLPATVEFSGNSPSGERVQFRTLTEITPAPVRIEMILVKNSKGFENVTGSWLRGEGFYVFGTIPQQKNSELYIGFSKPLPKNAWVSLFFLSANPRSGQEERSRLTEKIVFQDRTMSDGLTEKPVTDISSKEIPPHHSVRTAWEYLSVSRGDDPETWRLLQQQSGDVEDDTRSFTLDGSITIRVTGRMRKKSLSKETDKYYYLRCRFADGAYDLPPKASNIIMNGVLAEQAVPASEVKWIIAIGAVITGKTPSCGDTIQFNVTFNEKGEINQLNILENESTIPKFFVLEFSEPTETETGILHIEAALLGYSTGKPLQQLGLIGAPVKKNSFQLFTLEHDVWHIWALQPDFDASSRSDAHFLLDPVSGLIMFGDGEKGRIPSPNGLVFAVFDYTCAEKGTLAPGEGMKLIDSSHNRALLKNSFENIQSRLASITNQNTPQGGASAETLTDTIGRAIALLDAPHRAVSLRDYEEFARKTPGVQIARVKAIANYNPEASLKDSPGIITVVVLPYLPIPKPYPSPGMMQAVANYLNCHRIIGTKVRVVGPVYIDVIVIAKVRARAGMSKLEIRQRIEGAIKDFLDPLTGGPERTGWPFGRHVYRSEILQVIDEVPGVDHVLSLIIMIPPNQLRNQNQPISLIASRQHSIEVVFEKQ